MKQMICEMCGSNNLIKQDGLFVCQNCQTKYSVEDAKNLMVECNITNHIDAEVVNIVNDNKQPDFVIKEGVLVEYHGVRDEVTIPEDVVVIGEKAFADNARVKKVHLPSKLESIRKAAFFNCTALSSVDIPESVKTIEENAFYHCSMLKEVKLPGASGITIDDSAFLLTGFVLPHEYGGYIEGTNELIVSRIETGTKDYNRGWVEGSCNSAGGVDLKITFKNNSGSTINKIWFTVRAKNSIGEYVKGSYNTFIEERCHSNGPFESGAKLTHYWSCAWYNNGIKSADFVNIILIMSDGKKIFIPEPSIVSGSNSTDDGKSGGCYIATAVYGSYDCPQVWTLRRYRDYTLAETWLGRTFIRIYYAVSPVLVRCFGNTKWFKRIWKTKLDKMINKLNSQGVLDTPYKDKEFWANK